MNTRRFVHVCTCGFFASLYLLTQSHGQERGATKVVLETEQEKLQGTWFLVKLESRRLDKAIEGDGTERFVFAGTTVTILKGEEKEESGSFRLDPTKRPPEIDFTYEDGKEKETRLGIYELRQNALKICIAKDPDPKSKTLPRPKSFQRNRSNFIYYLKRK